MLTKGGICLAWRLLFFDKNNGDKYSTEKPEEDLMNLLVEKTKALGRMLTFADASNDPEMVQPNNYAYYFGSFGQAAEIAWRRARSSNSSSSGLVEQRRKPAEATKPIYQISKEPCRKEVNCMDVVQEEKQRKGKGARYTAKEVKSALVAFYNRTKRLPSPKDAQKYDSGLPSWGTMIKFLGPKAGWQAIIEGSEASPSEDVTTPRETPSAEGTPAAETVAADSVETSEEAIVTEKPVKQAEKASEDSTPPQDDYDNAEEMSEGCGRSSEKSIHVQQNEDIRVEAHSQKQGGIAKFELKVTLPDREKPIFITLAV